jgi:hypothetical protein
VLVCICNIVASGKKKLQRIIEGRIGEEAAFAAVQRLFFAANERVQGRDADHEQASRFVGQQTFLLHLPAG